MRVQKKGRRHRKNYPEDQKVQQQRNDRTSKREPKILCQICDCSDIIERERGENIRTLLFTLANRTVVQTLEEHFHLDELKAKTKESIRVWFYCKLLLAAICEALDNVGRFSPCSQFSFTAGQQME